MTSTVYTIGHSTHPIDGFIGLLKRHGITALADVRSSPYSRFNPQFNRETLRAALDAADIQYVFLGDELGARSQDRSCYVNGRAEYELLAKTQQFQHGLTRVAQGAEKHVIALMCAEKDPLTCHRTVLVARHLALRGLDIQHILEDGRLESHGDAVARLLAETGVPDHDLFRSREELIDEAYHRRGMEIAYTESPNDEQRAEGATR